MDDVCDRDIKNAVIDAAMRTVRVGSTLVTLDILISSVSKIKAARIKHDEERKSGLTIDERAEIKEKVKGHIEARREATAIELPDM